MRRDSACIRSASRRRTPTVWLIVPDSPAGLRDDEAVRRVESRQSLEIEITGVIEDPKDSGASDQITLHKMTNTK